MNLGYGESIITPREGKHRLAGYIKRKEYASCILDHIYIKVLVLEPLNDSPLVISSVDLLAIDNNMFNDIFNVVRTYVGNAELVVSATHTHSAPSTLYRNLYILPAEDFDPDYYQFFLESFEKVLQSALENKEKVACHIHNINIYEKVATNRRDPKLPIDSKAVILTCQGNKNKAGIINYGIHPTVLGPQNLCISRDLPGIVEDVLYKETGVKYIFINGAAADVSTRFTRKNQTYEEVIRLGTLLAYNILKEIDREKPIELKYSALLKKTKKVEVVVDKEKFKKLTNINADTIHQKRIQNDVIQNSGYKRLLESIKEALEALEIIEKNIARLSDTLEITIEAIGLGNLGIVAFPGEAISKASIECREKAEGVAVIFAGYSNGYYGYFSDMPTLDSYEDLMTLFTAESVTKVYKSLIELCQWLKSKAL